MFTHSGCEMLKSGNSFVSEFNSKDCFYFMYRFATIRIP